MLLVGGVRTVSMRLMIPFFATMLEPVMDALLIFTVVPVTLTFKLALISPVDTVRISRSLSGDSAMLGLIWYASVALSMVVSFRRFCMVALGKLAKAVFIGAKSVKGKVPFNMDVRLAV